MNWKVSKLLVDDTCKAKSVSGEVKALLAMMLMKEMITEKEMTDIVSWASFDTANTFRTVKGW